MSSHEDVRLLGLLRRICECLTLGIAIAVLHHPGITHAYLIKFDPEGIYQHTFLGNAGAIEYRNGPAIETNVEIIPPSTLPATRENTNLNGQQSPVQTIDGNPGTGRVIADLAVAHASATRNMELVNGQLVPVGPVFPAPAGALSQSISGTGTWRVIAEPGDRRLSYVALSGNLRGQVAVAPPNLGNASARLSGNVRVDPFGSFGFDTQQQQGGGSFGVGVEATGGSINFSVPGGVRTTENRAFTGISRAVTVGGPNTFSLGADLATSLSRLANSGGVASLFTEEFRLRAITEPPPPVPHRTKPYPSTGANKWSLSFNSITGELSFPATSINFLNLLGDESLDPIFSNDPILGAVLAIERLTLTGVRGNGFVFQNGAIRISNGVETFFSATIPELVIDDTMLIDFGVNMFASLDLTSINPESPFLLEYFNHLIDTGSLTELFGVTAIPVTEIIRSGRSFTAEVENLSIGFSSVSEPSTFALLAFAAICLWLHRRYQRTELGVSRMRRLDRSSAIGERAWGLNLRCSPCVHSAVGA